MKYLRLLPFCLSVLALPLILTGCKPSGEDASSTAADTNAAPAPAATEATAPAPATAAPAAAETNAAPAAATTNAPSGT